MCKSSYFQVEAMQSSEIKTQEIAIDEKYFLQLMDAIKNRDMDKALEIWVGDKDKSNTDIFTNFFNYWNGREITSYKKLSEERRPENKEKKIPSGITCKYEIVSEDKLFQVVFSITDEYKGGRYIDSVQFYGEKGTSKTDNSWNQFKFVKWGLLAFQIVEIAFSLYMAFRCIREKPKFWGIWLPFILLIYGGVVLDITSGLKVGVFVYILRWTEVFISHNGIRIALALPIGAVVYWLQRRKRRVCVGSD